MHTEPLNYPHGDVTCRGHLAYDPADASRRPCVLIAHTWGGLGDFERQAADRLARLGYIGFAIDIYGDGKRGNSGEENAALMQPFVQDRRLLRDRLLAAVTAAKQLPMADPARIGAIGFCFGGLCAIDIARSAETSIRGVVSFHGLLHPPAIGEQAPITAKVLILHGYDDPMAKPEAVVGIGKELTEAGADWQLHAYGGVMHAFTNPAANMPQNGLQFNVTAARRAWQSMDNFFAEVFG